MVLAGFQWSPVLWEKCDVFPLSPTPTYLLDLNYKKTRRKTTPNTSHNSVMLCWRVAFLKIIYHQVNSVQGLWKNGIQKTTLLPRSLNVLAHILSSLHIPWFNNKTLIQDEKKCSNCQFYIGLHLHFGDTTGFHWSHSCWYLQEAILTGIWGHYFDLPEVIIWMCHPSFYNSARIMETLSIRW